MPVLTSKLRSSPALRRSGYTLVEMLVVCGIVVLLLVMALPAFQYITGSRSLEAAQNQIAAYLGRARTEAMAKNRPFGVFFFMNPDNNRVNMAMVEPPSFVNWDIALPYKAIDGVCDPAGLAGSNYYVAIQDVPTAPAIPISDSTYWEPFAGFTTVDLASGSSGEFVALHPQVGVQLVNTSSITKYAMPGLILFDANGNLTIKRFKIYKSSRIGTATKYFVSPVTATSSAAIPSQFGLVLYNSRDFRTKYPTVNDGNYGSIPTIPAGSSADEWLTSNAVSLIVGRYNGTLIKCE